MDLRGAAPHALRRRAEEIAHRRGTRLHRPVRAAAFPFLRTIAEFDFTHQSTLRLTTNGSLRTPDVVTDGTPSSEGKPGRGKRQAHLAIAHRVPRSAERLRRASSLPPNSSTNSPPLAAKGSCARRKFAIYIKPHVLIVGESAGYLTYGDDAANVLYHVVNDRHLRRRATVFTANKPRVDGETSSTTTTSRMPSLTASSNALGSSVSTVGPSIRSTRPTTHSVSISMSSMKVAPVRMSGKDRSEFPEKTGQNARN